MGTSPVALFFNRASPRGDRLLPVSWLRRRRAPFGGVMMKRTFVLGCSAMTLLLAVSCATQRPTRSYVQPNYVDKTMFSGEWYFRQTVTDVPATTVMSFVGESSPMEKVRWEIQEKFLVAYRTYELIPGSDPNVNQTNKGPNATQLAAGATPNRADG